MPLADKTGLVTTALQGFSERDLFDIEKLTYLGTLQRFSTYFAGKVIHESSVRRELPRHDRGTRRGADGTGRIGAGETHSERCERIDVWRFVNLVPVTRQATPAHVVD